MLKKLFSIILMGTISLSSFSQQESKERMNLMPWPNEVKLGQGNFKISPDFIVKIEGSVADTSRIYKASTRFIRYMTDKTGVFLEEGFAVTATDSKPNATLLISFDTASEIKMDVDESYTLKVTEDYIQIKASTDIGAMHALSTLLQLITVTDGEYVIPAVVIEDEPRFIWRGLMMDVSRHFMPVEVIKRNLDAMAFVKLNVFHWHLSDDQGFRIESKSLPNLHRKASDGQFYTHSQIRDIVKYAGDRGIRVVPEIDVPGHATAILTAYPELSSKKEIDYSLQKFAGIFDPTLDPTNDNTYVFLDTLMKELTPLFPDQYFHIGGDENEGKHWDENADIQRFMKDHGLKDNHELQTYFNIKLEKILAKYGKSLMGWEEIMTPKMPTSALIHAWKGVNEGMEPGQAIVEAIKNGYKTILSNGYYIDLMFSVEDHYLVDPIPNVPLTVEESNRVLGGEVTSWSELVTPLTVDSRIWPRAAAIAERFWSQQDVKDVDDMFRRLADISQSLELMGLKHIQVKDYLLRNIANYQDTRALRSLTYISEPYKIYARNAGGTQYKTYSPFTLFADACSADAKDVRAFAALVNLYISEKSPAVKKEILDYLNHWQQIVTDLELLQDKAPLIKTIIPYAKRVAEISRLSVQALNQEEISEAEMRKIESLLLTNEDNETNIDVELAVSDDILKLVVFLAR